MIDKINKAIAKIAGIVNLPVDKTGHVLVGIFLAVVLAAIFGLKQPVYILCLVVVAGIGKELYDYLYNKYIQKIHGVELLDVAATVIGGIIGLMLAFVVSSFL